MSAPSPAPYDLVKLREIIARSDYTDLRLFCADLSEDYNTIVGEGKTVRDAALSIVKYFENRGRIPELIERVRREFPSAEWAAVSNQLPPPPTIVFGSGASQSSSTQSGHGQVTQEPSKRAPGPLRVFLCHASSDKAKARELYAQLKVWGAQPWLDEEDLIAGQNWRYEIQQAVQRSDVVLVCLSKASVTHEGFIKDEIGYALNQADRQAEVAIFVVPLRLEECQAPERLARWHWVNWFEPRGEERLQRALRRRADEVSATLVAAGPTQPRVTTPPTTAQSARSALSRTPTKPRVSRRALLAALSGVAGVGAAAWAVSRLIPPVALTAPTPDPLATAVTQPVQPTEAAPTAEPATLLPAVQSTSLPLTLSLTTPIKMDLVLVPAGPFLMGSKRVDKSARDNEFDQFSLPLANFYIGKTEVTNSQFRSFVNATRYTTAAEAPDFKGYGYSRTNGWDSLKGADWQHPNGPDSNIDQKAEHPVVLVNWFDAMKFCNWLKRVDGRNFVLPSEAEWEKAARGTSGHIYPWGNKPLADEPSAIDYLNFNFSVGDTTPVEHYSLNGKSIYGCVDMSGNVWEWTRSMWGKYRSASDFNYPYDASDGREDLVIGDAIRVLRGGSWGDDHGNARAAYRNNSPANDALGHVGFRVALVAPPFT
jgi:formylglycine-generating enzyme required for sulfatase activity